MILSLPEYFVNLTIISLVDDWFLLNLMGVLCASWISMPVSFPRLGKFSAMICSRNPSTPFSLSLHLLGPLRFRCYSYLFIYLKHLFIFETERDRAWTGGGPETEGDTESETGSRLWAVSTETDAGLKLTSRKIMTWAEVRCFTNWDTWASQSLSVLRFYLKM